MKNGPRKFPGPKVCITDRYLLTIQRLNPSPGCLLTGNHIVLTTAEIGNRDGPRGLCSQWDIGLDRL